ncbi:alpha/beta-hydrolase [Lojkania enalia]|uniref:Alpha/beta-hydrolase n=1 Tax=Lojkania enalia TaxID=147567 RepID=A0A9P4MWP2_9PLEO|nr:alpha/beta-hydrolase [Didymosphaeria enalia]
MGYQTLAGDYSISAKFCRPDNGYNGNVIQLLSHGIGFDKTYWDLSFNDYNYSYVEVAINNGYTTLAIDRLGIGNSSHGDPINAIQAQAEIEALNSVTAQLRSGHIPGISQAFSKVIHVGHSFGSIQSYWFSSLYPNNTDGLVLTGYGPNGSFLPTTVASWNLRIARLDQPLRFGNASNALILRNPQFYGSNNRLVRATQAILRELGFNVGRQEIWEDIATTELANLINGYNTSVVSLDYPSGYLVWPDLTANQYAFLLKGRYDVGLGLAAESGKQPVTAGELLTIGSSPALSSFAGPVLVFTGSHDQPFCGGDCFSTGGTVASIPAQAKQQFPNASAFEAYIQPETAHGLNLHYNATAGYKVIQNWLGSHGLAA